MLLATLRDRQNVVTGRLEGHEQLEKLVLRLQLEPAAKDKWSDVVTILAGYTFRLGLDGVVLAFKTEGNGTQQPLSELVTTLSRGELHFQWEAGGIEAAHDLETKLRRNKGRHPVHPGAFVELTRQLSTN